ncbi:terpene synthase 17-like [Lycium ferocissimum]|uniref:terpene synthase 17-like n=1 Tax=Lycium ferocissimum TaxID=112874 RepID=UPI00281634BD|nr:terpene synthase 17-like [Lycium ferocissimum]
MESCTQNTAADEVITRRSGKHHPTVWGDHFLAYANLPGANKGEEKQHEDLKQEVRKMLEMAPSKSLQNLDLINTIQCLGVAYQFEREIDESLSYMYTRYEEWIGEVDGSDLHAIALCFRLLRQQGYYVSCDAFRKFTDDQGNFNKELVKDVPGMLSLYEAAQFRVHGEEILDEALNFTITRLKLSLPKLSNSLAQQVSNALKFPIKDGMVRVETRKYVSFYQENESHNEVLLNFAKLDFNILQRLHKKELCDITRWQKELEMVKGLPYARDRLVELYFWSLGVYFEPQYRVARKILTKVLCFISILDDTYDIYGTLDELTLLTEAIERWNVDASEQLPPYLKIIYRGLLDVYNEVEKELAHENKSFLVDYSITEMKKVLRSYFQEAKWYHWKKVPTMEHYVKNGIPSSGYQLLATTCWLGMGEVATKDAFDWIATEPPILVASCIITRLLNDLLSHEHEQERGDVASGIECYMNEYGVTKEEAHIEIRKIIENHWKDLNQEYLNLTTVIPRILLMTIINLTRGAEFIYKDEDAYTFSKNNLKDVISVVLIDPII